MDAQQHDETGEPRAQAWGERLAFLRQSKGISREALASGAALDIDMIDEIESGLRIPSEDEINRLARTLHVPPTALSPFSVVAVDSTTVDVTVGHPAIEVPGQLGTAGWLGSVDPQVVRTDFEQHFAFSAHLLVRVAREAQSSIQAAQTVLARVMRAEWSPEWAGPSAADLTAIAGLDTIADAWDRVGRPTQAWQFKSWFDELEAGEEPVVIGLQLRDSAVRAACARGVRGLRYSCEECRRSSASAAGTAALIARVRGGEHSGIWAGTLAGARGSQRLAHIDAGADHADNRQRPVTGALAGSR